MLKEFNKMEEKYINPRDFEDIIVELKTCHSMVAVKDLIQRIFPSLIQGFSRGYSNDYPKLTQSWTVMCKALKTLPKGIVLVEFVPPPLNEVGSERFSLLRKFLDTMTCNGFIVRRGIEFFFCSKCKMLLPSHDLYQKMKFIKPEGMPERWDINCKKCEEFESLTDENGNPTLFPVSREEIKEYIDENPNPA